MISDFPSTVLLQQKCHPYDVISTYFHLEEPFPFSRILLA